VKNNQARTSIKRAMLTMNRISVGYAKNKLSKAKSITLGNSTWFIYSMVYQNILQINNQRGCDK